LYNAFWGRNDSQLFFNKKIEAGGLACLDRDLNVLRGTERLRGEGRGPRRNFSKAKLTGKNNLRGEPKPGKRRTNEDGSRQVNDLENRGGREKSEWTQDTRSKKPRISFLTKSVLWKKAAEPQGESLKTA